MGQIRLNLKRLPVVRLLLPRPSYPYKSPYAWGEIAEDNRLEKRLWISWDRRARLRTCGNRDALKARLEG
jgi:hypothetical protein